MPIASHETLSPKTPLAKDPSRQGPPKFLGICQYEYPLNAVFAIFLGIWGWESGGLLAWYLWLGERGCSPGIVTTGKEAARGISPLHNVAYAGMLLRWKHDAGAACARGAILLYTYEVLKCGAPVSAPLAAGAPASAF